MTVVMRGHQLSPNGLSPGVRHLALVDKNPGPTNIRKLGSHRHIRKLARQPYLGNTFLSDLSTELRSNALPVCHHAPLTFLKLEPTTPYQNTYSAFGPLSHGLFPGF